MTADEIRRDTERQIIKGIGQFKQLIQEAPFRTRLDRQALCVDLRQFAQYLESVLGDLTP